LGGVGGWDPQLAWVSGGLPPRPPAKAAKSHTMGPASPAATNSPGMGRPASSAAAPMGKDTMGAVGKNSMGQPGVLHLGGMPAGAVRVWRNPRGRLEARLAVYGLTPRSSHHASLDRP